MIQNENDKYSNWGLNWNKHDNSLDCFRCVFFSIDSHRSYNSTYLYSFSYVFAHVKYPFFYLTISRISMGHICLSLLFSRTSKIHFKFCSLHIILTKLMLIEMQTLREFRCGNVEISTILIRIDPFSTLEERGRLFSRSCSEQLLDYTIFVLFWNERIEQNSNVNRRHLEWSGTYHRWRSTVFLQSTTYTMHSLPRKQISDSVCACTM